MASRKIMFHLLEAIFQTGTRERRLEALSMTGTKSLSGLLRVQYLFRYSAISFLIICQ